MALSRESLANRVNNTLLREEAKVGVTALSGEWKSRLELNGLQGEGLASSFLGLGLSCSTSSFRL